MYPRELPQFPFAVEDDGASCKVYAYATGTYVHNKYHGYRHICDDELRVATGGNWGIIPDGLRLESRVSVEFLYIIGGGI